MKNVTSMRRSASILGVAWLLAGAAIASLGCGRDDDGPRKSDPGGGATETNVAPAPCSKDDDCPDGVDCNFFDGGAADAGGFCDVGEMEVVPGVGTPVSSATPAPCARDEDCPEGVDCVVFSGGSTGFCDVDEMVENP